MSYPLQLPNGSVMQVPDNVPRDEAEDNARKWYPQLYTPPEPTFGGALQKGLGSLASGIQTLGESAFKGANPAAEAAIRRSRALTEQYGEPSDFGRVAQAYKEKGLFPAGKELLKQSGLALTENLPQMGAIAAGAAAGEAAFPFGGGFVGAGLAALAPRVASNIESQAIRQKVEGKPTDVDVGQAVKYGIPMAGLDVAANILPLGRTIAGKMFGPGVAKLLERGETDLAETAARSVLQSMGRGVAVNLAEQVPIQVAQAALQRAQTGQSLTGPEAFSDYGNAAYTAGLFAPLGAFGGLSEKGAARKELAAKEAEKNKPFIGPPAPEPFVGPTQPPFVGPPAPPPPPPGPVFTVTPEGDVITRPETTDEAFFRHSAKDLSEKAQGTVGPPVPQKVRNAIVIAEENRAMEQMRKASLDIDAQAQAEAEAKETEPSGQVPMPYSTMGTPGETVSSISPIDIARNKAIDAITAAGKATITVVKDATGLKTKEATALLQQLEKEGFLTKPDGANRRKIAAPPEQFKLELPEPEEVPSVPNTSGINIGHLDERGVPTSTSLSGESGITEVPETDQSKPSGLDNTGRVTGKSNAGKTEVEPSLNPRKEIVDARNKANDAYENDEIDDRTYARINEELKKSLPNLNLINRLLAGEKLGPRGILVDPQIAEEKANQETEVENKTAPTKQKIIPSSVEDATAAIVKMREETNNPKPSEAFTPSLTNVFQVGDSVRYGNTPGIVVGVEGDSIKFRPDNSTNPKAYQRVSHKALKMVSRPGKGNASASKIGESLGEEAGKFDVDKTKMIQTMGNNMYSANVVDTSVKELLQNAYDAVKAAVHKGLYKSGKITISTDYETRIIKVQDDGVGMTPDVVKKAFFTIGGSHKSDLPPELRSGGLGLAKLGFMLGSERIKLDTVKDGVRVIVNATPAEILNDNFKIQKFTADKNDHGTTVEVTVPKTYVDGKGNEKPIYMPSSLDHVTPLSKPLIGPVELKTKNSFGEEKTLPTGIHHNKKEMPKFTTINFDWGTADLYIGDARKDYPQQRVLSSGVYQFDEPFNITQSERFPHDIILDIKPNVEAQSIDYPFENSRERFKSRMEEDIKALKTYVATIGRGLQAKELQETMRDVISMPRIEVGEKVDERLLKKTFASPEVATGGKKFVPPESVNISDGDVVDSIGKLLASIKPENKPSDRNKEASFEAEKEAPKNTDFMEELSHDPTQPIFHNNTNVDFIKIGEEYGNPKAFFAELGSVLTEMKEELAKSGIYGYEKLSPENGFYAGVAIDKQYGGLHIKIPYPAVLINPFYEWGAKTLSGVRSNLMDTMIHEIAHTGDMSHGVGHNNEMMKVGQYLHDIAMYDYFRDNLMDILTRHESAFAAMKEAYGKYSTKNIAKSLEEYSKDASATSARGDTTSGDSEPRPVSTRGGSGRNEPLSSASRLSPESNERRSNPTFSSAINQIGSEKERTGTASATKSTIKIDDSTTDKEKLDSIAGAPLDYPEPTPGLLNKGLNVLSNAPVLLKNAVNSILSLHQMFQMYGKDMPGLGVLEKLMNIRGTELIDRQKKLGDNLRKWMDTIKNGKFSEAELNTFYDIALRTSMYQVEVLKSRERPEIRDANGKLTQKAVKLNTDNIVYKQFDALHPELKKIYEELRNDYDQHSKEFLDNLTAGLNTTAAEKLRAKFESTRIPIYLPFFRQGNLWLSYQDENNHTVKMAFNSPRERELGREKIEKEGATDIREYNKIRDLRRNGPPPTGFLNEVLETLANKGIKDEGTLDSIYEAYLDYLPAESLRQRFRSRDRSGVLGMQRDIINTYANVASAMVSNLNNIKHAKTIEDALNQVRLEVEMNPTTTNASALKTAEAQVEFMRNPKINDLVSRLGNYSYTWYLAANASSAFVNMTHLPMVVLPLLSGKYGWGSSTSAFFKAMKNFKTIEDKIPAGYEAVFRKASEEGALGSHVAQELFELRRKTVADYTGLKYAVDSKLNWMFKTADRANREMTLMAAYDLAFNDTDPKSVTKGNSIASADAAIRMVKDAYGSSLAAVGPRILQNGFAKVALTFKRFALNRDFILARTFSKAFKDEDAAVKAMARRQLLGIYGTAALFSGVAGMPLVGMATMLSSLLLDDADQPLDPEAEIRKAIGSLAWKGPINQLFNIEVSARTGWNNMLWKDDPKRLAEVGPFLYTLDRAMGPAFSAFTQAYEGLGHFHQGDFQRGFEAVTPAAIRNVIKSLRYAGEGAISASGEKIGDVGPYNVMMQALGFAPADVAEKRAEAGAMTEIQRKLETRKNRLLSRAYVAQLAGNYEGEADAMDDINKFNEKNPNIAITGDTISRDFEAREKKAIEAVYGANLRPKLREQLMEQQGVEN